MYVILVDGMAVYAATSEVRFGHELAEYASIGNVTWELRKSQAK